MTIIDLRSDTVTLPSEEMRKAIYEARVGDDVLGEDPTVNELQDKICKLTGKEASLFVTSGTQANQVAINAHTQPGDEVICEYRSHIFNYECGAPGLLSGVQLHPLQSDYGILEPDKIIEAIRPDNAHFPKSRLIAVENTHNRWGGTIYPLEAIKELRNLADEYGLKLHLDGARLWNASVATKISIKEYASYFDSVAMCFSKGLGAPAGSIISGDREFIKKAHYYRKVYGGGMRQAGFLAAAALYAIQNNIERLLDDHHRARVLAEGINALPGFIIDLEAVQTNIVVIDTSLNHLTAPQIAEALDMEGVKLNAFAPTRLRAVTHLHITDDDIKMAIEAFKTIN
ncbi:MAG: low-specificity L-threonine aldolase [Calditrichaceae bacterium]|nr:low-specificity L-threonine aldolase [Calditrichaceae bacterium]MBN2708778.1 low-specificity L-threonine aldolase [Calditrichaceae bacterium]RQV97691.1 MAG: low-specificity L-threonine aldolase [Calditrichota bacterium]HES59888.1 low-specificity L-threonine aldolase [Caldithrix sp.]